MKPLTLGALGALAVVSIAAPLSGQAPPAGPAGVRGEILAQFDDAATKLLQLGEAIPPEKYAWRPGAGVRSVSQVLMHVSGAGYFFLGLAGVPAPAGLPQDGENTVTDKAQVLEQLRRSSEHVRAAIRGIPDADLDKPVTMFGRPTTKRNLLLLTATHAHEHLGQLIAYARSNSVVPPWSRAGGGGGGGR
jgi:uncharacterized damage-inducible protein DinB